MTVSPGLSRGRAWLVAVVATLAMSVSYVDRQVVSAIATSVRRALDVDAEHFGYLAGAFSLAYLVAAPLAGAVVDRVGARRGLVVAILAWSAVSAAHALVPSFAALVTLRIVLGTAEAPSFPAAAQSVRRALPPGDRSAAFGLLFTGSSLGAAVAAPLAIWLDVHFGWRTAFLIASLVGLAWLPLWLLVTRAPTVRAVLAHPDVGLPPVASRPRVSPVALFLDPAVLRALLLVIASAPALMFIFVWMPQYLELGRGIPKPEVARYVWLPPLMADVGMVSFGLLASRLDRRKPTQRSHVGLVLVAATMESAMILVPRLDATWPAMFALGLSAAGGGGLYTLLTADMMARIDPSRVSMAGGLTAAAQSLVYVVMNPVVGRWIDRTHSFDGALVGLAVVALPGAVLWSLVPAREAGEVIASP
ncbi:MAG TPA: MFS transporter [Polyangiaceae bacterium]|jgi:ACS family hexuronate transporter-like MFS transporter